MTTDAALYHMNIFDVIRKFSSYFAEIKLFCFTRETGKNIIFFFLLINLTNKNKNLLVNTVML